MSAGYENTIVSPIGNNAEMFTMSGLYQDTPVRKVTVELPSLESAESNSP